MSTSRSTLRDALALKMRTRAVSGTATGGSTVAVADTGRDEESDYWNHSWVTVTDTSGTATETREVNDFTTGVSGGTGQMDVLRAFSFTVAAGDTYELHQKLSVDELNDAINSAIDGARGKIIIKAVETTTSTTSVYEYTLATDTGKVFKIELQADKGTATYPYTDITLKSEIRDDEGTLTLSLDFDPGDGYTIRYHHIKEQSRLTADSATTDLPLDYIYDAARAELYEVLAADAKDDQEFRRYMTKADDFKRDARGLLRHYSTQKPASKVIKRHSRLGGEGWYETTYGKDDLK